MNEVDGWLRKGLGRAATFLKTHDSRPWREQLLYARTHDLAYDSRCEPTRAPYLWDLIELSGEPDFYREQIIEFLGKDDEELYLEQIFAIAANFAANGSHIAKEAMYGAFQRRGFAAAGIGCAEQLVILDGLNGLLFVARTFGELEVDERPWKFGVLIEELEKHHGKQVLPSELDRFVQEWQEDEKSRASEQVKVPKPRLNYDEINRRIVEKGRRSGMVYWGKSATDEELAKLAHDVLSETDSGRLYGFLRMFQYRAFPGPLDRLMELARGADEDIASAAMIALSNITDPAIRALALEAANRPAWGRFAVRLLIRNGESDDYRLIERFLQEQLDPAVYHELGYAVRDFVKAHREERAERSLNLLYESGPCALCRRGAVEELIAINQMPQWMVEECRYDSYPETRKLVASR